MSATYPHHPAFPNGPDVSDSESGLTKLEYVTTQLISASISNGDPITIQDIQASVHLAATIIRECRSFGL